MSEETEQANAGRPRRGAVDYSALLDEKRRNQFDMVNRLRMRLIEIDTSGNLVGDPELLEEVRQAIKEILQEFVLVSVD